MINVSVTVENANFSKELKRKIIRVTNHIFLNNPHPFLCADFCSDCDSLLESLQEVNFGISEEDVETLRDIFNDVDLTKIFYNKFSEMLSDIKTASTTAQASILAEDFAKEIKRLEESIFYGETYCID